MKRRTKAELEVLVACLVRMNAQQKAQLVGAMEQRVYIPKDWIDDPPEISEEVNSENGDQIFWIK